MKYSWAYLSVGDKINELPGRMRASFPEITDELFWTLYATAS